MQFIVQLFSHLFLGNSNASNVLDKDGPRSSNLYGGCKVYVEGVTLFNDWGTGDWEDRFGLGEDDDVISALESRKDIKCGTYTDLDDQIEAYCFLTGDDISEYYFYDDSECPQDVEEMELIENEGLDEVTFDGREYYIIDYFEIEPDDRDKGEFLKYACDKQTKIDNDSRYKLVILEFSDESFETPVALLDTNYMYSTYSCCLE